MNDIFNLNTDAMVRSEMDEFKREMEMVQLLHEAGLAGPSLTERMALVIGNSLVKLGEHLRRYRTIHSTYQTVSRKIAV